MHVKNIGLALVELTSRMPASMLPPEHAAKQHTPRVVQIGLFLEQHYKKASAFDDTKYYVEELTFAEAQYLLEGLLPKLGTQVS